MTVPEAPRRMKRLTDLEMDRLLQDMPPENPSASLRARVLELVAQPQSQRIWWWPFGPLWQPATVLLCSAFIGFALGTTTPAEPLADDSRENIMILVFGPEQEDWQ
ncbi:MAG: hypothetical protein HQL76_11595 [Magnetococcales bacterium]|nr:hypothetical protein [Magnetococcales bacterium]